MTTVRPLKAQAKQQEKDVRKYPFISQLVDVGFCVLGEVGIGREVFTCKCFLGCFK